MRGEQIRRYYFMAIGRRPFGLLPIDYDVIKLA